MKFNIAPLPAQYAYACGTYIATFDAMSIGDENNKQIALVVMDHEEWAKYLKLISAAPDLLEALINLRASFSEYVGPNCDAADAAIAKALGEQ